MKCDEVTERVLAVLGYVPVGVSNRHVHLSQTDFEKLFGSTALTPYKALKQPGQFAAKETVTLRGPKGAIESVRVLGPFRKTTQVEIATADGYKLGICAPVRASGNLEGTDGVTLVGPKGQVTLSSGVIAAHRHIHMSEACAEVFGVKDGDTVSLKSEGIRPTIFEAVTIRVSARYVLEAHVDVEEANAAGLSNGDLMKVMT